MIENPYKTLAVDVTFEACEIIHTGKMVIEYEFYFDNQKETSDLYVADTTPHYYMTLFTTDELEKMVKDAIAFKK